MKIRFILFSILISVIVNDTSSQAVNRDFVSYWEGFINMDDNEKNYRFTDFIKLANETLIKFEPAKAFEMLPANWNYAYSPDSLYIVFSAVMVYKNQENRLINVVVDKTQDAKAIYFVKNLGTGLISINKPVVDVKRNGNRYNLNIGLGTKQVLFIEDLELKILFSNLATSRNDADKVELSRSIWLRLQQLLASNNDFTGKFENFEELSTIISKDEHVKICTWNIEFNDGDNQFFGGIAVKTQSGIRTYELVDNYKNIRSPENATLTPSKWYGCIYYDIVETKYKGDIYYTLIGYNGNDAFSQIKIVDVLVLAGGNNPNPKFGHNLFYEDNRSKRRLIFEYSNSATMMLKYNEDNKMIIMDNLAPVNDNFKGDFRNYGPDFSYNGLKFEKGKWILQTDIDLRNTDLRKR